MKGNVRSMLGMGFFAALTALGSTGGESQKQAAQVASLKNRPGNGGYGSPVFLGGRSQKKKKSNRLRLTHNAKLKRRKSA